MISIPKWRKIETLLRAERGNDSEFLLKIDKARSAIDAARKHSDAARKHLPSLKRRKEAQSTLPLTERRATQRRRASASDIRFWHTFRDREKENKGVGDLIEHANHRVIITGGTLNQVVSRFETEMRRALNKGVLVGIIMTTPSENMLQTYDLYADHAMELSGHTQRNYKEFHDTLPASLRERFAVLHTDLPIMHSLGLYDEEIFVSEFCVDRHSEKCPSYSVSFGSPTYGAFFYEIHVLLHKSKNVLGQAKEKLLHNIDKDAKRTPFFTLSK